MAVVSSNMIIAKRVLTALSVAGAAIGFAAPAHAAATDPAPAAGLHNPFWSVPGQSQDGWNNSTGVNPTWAWDPDSQADFGAVQPSGAPSEEEAEDEDTETPED
ncbi:hypothetical protein ACWDUX_01620 [Streptomyces sp. NPDC003444]